jgi:hypothetical protein
MDELRYDISYFDAEWWLYGINTTPNTVTPIQRRVPSCSMISLIEASFRDRWNAQVEAFQLGVSHQCLFDERGYADQDPEETEDDENVWRVRRFPFLTWEPWMYTCFQYASASSGGFAQFFEDRDGVIIKVRREDPQHPTREWASLVSYPQYAPRLGPYEIRVSIVDFPVIKCRGDVRERERERERERDKECVFVSVTFTHSYFSLFDIPKFVFIYIIIQSFLYIISYIFTYTCSCTQRECERDRERDRE